VERAKKKTKEKEREKQKESGGCFCILHLADGSIRVGKL